VDLVKQSAVRFCVREVHPSTMAQWLRRLRLTKMTARPFHPKKDEAAQETFKLPDEVIQNGLPIEVWFQDEARVGQQALQLSFALFAASVGRCCSVSPCFR
jgi:hypothetical protein